MNNLVFDKYMPSTLLVKHMKNIPKMIEIIYSCSYFNITELYNTHGISTMPGTLRTSCLKNLDFTKS